MLRSILYTIVGRGKGLQEHLTGLIPPSASSGHLHNHLECFLCCSKIRQMQDIIRTDYSNQNNIRQMQALGYNLSTYQNINFSILKLIDNFRVRVLSAHTIPIHPRYASIWE